MDLSSWKEKIDIDQGIFETDSDEDEDSSEEVIHEKPDVSYKQHEKFKDGVLTIGCVGKLVHVYLFYLILFTSTDMT